MLDFSVQQLLCQRDRRNPLMSKLRNVVRQPQVDYFAEKTGMLKVSVATKASLIVNIIYFLSRAAVVYLGGPGAGVPLPRAADLPLTDGTLASSEPPFRYVSSCSWACLISSL